MAAMSQSIRALLSSRLETTLSFADVQDDLHFSPEFSPLKWSYFAISAANKAPVSNGAGGACQAPPEVCQHGFVSRRNFASMGPLLGRGIGTLEYDI